MVLGELWLAGGLRLAWRYPADHQDNQGKVHSAAREGAKVSPGSHWKIYSGNFQGKYILLTFRCTVNRTCLVGN